jgi:hypothetical protein
MKYFLISHSSDRKEIGDYPQTIPTEVIDANGGFEETSRANLTNEHFPNVSPALEFELAKKAKLTDVLSASNIQARGLLVNEKVKKILEQFNIMNHKFYLGSVTAKGKKLPYYWLHIVNTSFDGIDFEKSNFIETGFTGRKIGDVEINTFEDYDKISREKMLKVEKLILLPNSSIKDLDLFLFPEIHYRIIASERLISALQESTVSGIKTTEADFM